MSSDRDRRAVGPVHLLALGINGIVGVGIFFAPADIAARAPGAGTAIFAVTGLLLVPVAVAFAVLGGRFDEDGGPVVFARDAFGALPAFVVGWIAYVSAIASTAAVTAGLTAAVGPLVGVAGSGGQRAAATLLAAGLALVCAAGLRLSARTWTALTLLKLLPLVALGLVYLAAPVPVRAIGIPAVPHLPPSWLSAMLVATFTYQGFEIVPVLAGRARTPSTAVPFATVGSMVGAGILYVALQAACASSLPDLAASHAPLVETALVLGGPGLAAVVGAGTSLSALGITFGMMAATPFYLAALAGVDRLGLGLDAVDERGVPRRALFATWAWVTLLIQAGGRGELFALSSVAVLIQYIVTAAALFALAVRGRRGLGRRHAALAVPAGVIALALVAGASAREAGVAAAALAGGLVLRRAAHRRAASSR